ncbi:MAG: RecQ family zinc-binding domain-containing protein [Myxococcales bacterium]|nr:RecQ family zinc-binding domain-containing protein [Myxococcales bacterium]
MRIGRLPPRGATSSSPAPTFTNSSRVDSASDPSPPIAHSSPRPLVDAALWQRVETVARELELTELSIDLKKAIRAAVEGRDALVSMRSSFARAACFVIPSRILPQPVLVVGPRPAAMRELHDRLLQRRAPVVRFEPSGSESSRRQALERIAAGGSLLVLCTASSLFRDDLSLSLARSGVSLVAVVDAHTLTGASDELSPAMTELGPVLKQLGRPPIMALLGAATPVARYDVVDALALQSPVHVEAPLVGRNIELDVLAIGGDARQRALLQLVGELRRPGVIFAPTAREVDEIYAALSALRLPVHRFHPFMPPGDRVGEQLNFTLPGRRSIMVATSALFSATGIVGVGEAALLDKAPTDFGLCFEKKDLRFVLHWSAPASLEQYLREIALAGRDGESATCILFHDGSDRARHEATLAQARIPSRHLTHFARSLEPAAIDTRPRTLESLALASGLSRKLTESLAAMLDDAGLVSLSAGWLRVTATAPGLSSGAQRLAARLDRLRAQDDRRLSAMTAYLDGTGCRSARLARYFGEPSIDACGRCGGCKGSLLAGFEPVDRDGSGGRHPPVESFSLGRADSYGMEVAPPKRAASPLLAKLGDFQRRR